jgi:hypothetical protein
MLAEPGPWTGEDRWLASTVQLFTVPCSLLSNFQLSPECSAGSRRRDPSATPQDDSGAAVPSANGHLLSATDFPLLPQSTYNELTDSP